MQTLSPKYMEKFQCIGSKCEDTCCTGWRISVDKKTYKKYRNIKDSDFKKNLSKNILRDKKSENEEVYAYMRLDNDIRCTMLSEDLLCNIQLKFGESYLSNTCAIYPRNYNEVDNYIEESGSISCPEMARLVLLNPDKMEFDVKERSEKGFRNRVGKKIKTKKTDVSIEQHFWAIRMFTIKILQSRQYSISERLIILGFFCQEIEILINKNQLDNVDLLEKQFEYLLANKHFEDTLNDIPSNSITILKFLNLISKKLKDASHINTRYYEILKQVVQGFEFNETTIVENFVERFTEINNLYYQPYMLKNEHIMENYLVNYVFKNTFPLSLDKSASLIKNYYMMVVHFLLLKLHLIGLASHFKELNRDIIIKAIQSFSKTIEHNHEYLKQVYDLLEKDNQLRLDYIASILKD
ncbi:flagellin lysine-N-methylase [Bacillus sp. DTU_2020_1000418_1_SI_GHA_SEK_038]|uniref:flagellin lysine-N-methylase n=1 Tax=Bacillus sp. DTU_2020_1000418_1_SI_GHA_SEK_038 TaxID=3077585 RepID=UPI0028E85A38|nr:flagellin lysine-N-methylase [Bacillus sp. DTU_2020_1000418_1_SI_GHA_SEK_038]WNS75084.1 flagellin lysine-N-methylase [Bacillus sp. DTU_2020_1000418_1_SI_GHA_SEK_038]